VDGFFQPLEKEQSSLPADFVPQTLFVGGGTPTAPDFQTLEFFSAFANLRRQAFTFVQLRRAVTMRDVLLKYDHANIVSEMRKLSEQQVQDLETYLLSL